jgi:hypothetical protein
VISTAIPYFVLFTDKTQYCNNPLLTGTPPQLSTNWSNDRLGAVLCASIVMRSLSLSAAGSEHVAVDFGQ